jgi:hypothetical protein
MILFIIIYLLKFIFPLDIFFINLNFILKSPDKVILTLNFFILILRFRFKIISDFQNLFLLNFYVYLQNF